MFSFFPKGSSNFLDFQIEGEKTGFYSMVIATIGSFILLVADLLFKFENVSTFLLISLFVCCLLILLVRQSIRQKRNLGWVSIFLFLIFPEIQFFSSPTTYHFTQYWLVFAIILSLLNLRVKHALLITILVLITMLVNFFYMEKYFGDNYQINVSVSNQFIGIMIFILVTATIVFYMSILVNISENNLKITNENLQISLKNGAQALENLKFFQKKIFTYYRDCQFSETESPTEYFEKVLFDVRDALKVDVMSLWRFQNFDTEISNVFFIDKDGVTYKDLVQSERDYPDYFRAMKKEFVIVADDAVNNQKTSDFSESYLIPFGIKSMLDCALVNNGKLVGLICCESQKERKWTIEEELFLQSVADLLCIKWLNQQMVELAKEISDKNEELSTQHQEMQTMNEELASMNEELYTMNDQLENIVKERTAKLEDQNSVLKEYAFINAHLLRAPLSRIMGLNFLIQAEKDDTQREKLLKYLDQSSTELDTVIKQMALMLDGNMNVDRQDVMKFLKSNGY